MKNIFKITALFSIIILNSCTQEKKIFRTDLKDNGDKKTLTYIPNMEFKVIKDSAFLYFNQEDYKRVLSGDIKVGKEIYKIIIVMGTSQMTLKLYAIVTEKILL